MSRIRRRVCRRRPALTHPSSTHHLTARRRSYPFLLVDRVLEWEAGVYAVGYKCVTANDNFFPGHFPQRAIMPGVLQVGCRGRLGG